MAAERSYTYTPTVIRLWRWGDGTLEIPAARDGNDLFVPVAFLCEDVLNIHKRTQSAIIRERFVEHEEWRDGVPFTLHGGLRMMLAIRTPEAALWIAGIDARRVKPSARDSLEAFCTELKHEAERLLFGAAPRAPVALRGTARDGRVSMSLTMACEECGAEHDISYADGDWTVTLRRTGDA